MTKTVYAIDGGEAIIMYDPQLVAEISEGMEPLDAYFDGTFKTCPKLKNLYQTVTLMVRRYGYVSIDRFLKLERVKLVSMNLSHSSGAISSSKVK